MKWNYNTITTNIYRLPHHKGPKLEPHLSIEHTGRLRNAIDFALDVGTPIYAALDGVVDEAIDGFEDNGRAENEFLEKSNLVRIRHDDGEYSEYGHLKKGSILVKRDQKILTNQQFGEVGFSGFTNYSHLHFEVFIDRPAKNRKYRDPTLLVQFRYRNKIFTMRSPNKE